MEEIQKTEYNGTLVLTTQQIANAYGTNTDTITKNFNRNKDRYVDGKHYICLKGDELREFKANGQIDLLPSVNTLYLWTKKGAFLHAKSLNTDTAWEVYDRLVDSYFDKQSASVDLEQLDPQTKLMNLLVQSISRNELEQKRQAEQLNRIEEKQEAIADTFQKVDDTEDFQKWANNCISQIAESPKFTKGQTRSQRYYLARKESYERLKQKRNCRLDDRVQKAIGRALEERPDIKKTELQKINKIYIIANDKDLRPAYELVIKEMMVCYCVKSA